MANKRKKAATKKIKVQTPEEQQPALPVRYLVLTTDGAKVNVVQNTMNLLESMKAVELLLTALQAAQQKASQAVAPAEQPPADEPAPAESAPPADEVVPEEPVPPAEVVVPEPSADDKPS